MKWVFGSWAALVVVLSGLLAYGATFEPFIGFLLVALPFTGMGEIWPVVAFLVAVPLSSFYFCGRAGSEGRLSAMTGFALVPAFAVFGPVGIYRGALEVCTQIQLNDYEYQIRQARQIGKNVRGDDASITIGPPVTALFEQRKMSWIEPQFIGYDESDRMDYRANLASDCEQPTISLGRHFFRLYVVNDCKKAP